MNASTIAGSLVVGLVFATSPVQAQSVAANVVVRSGPVFGHVVVSNGYSTYGRRPVVYRRAPERRVVVVERYHPRVIVVERMRHHRQKRHWERYGYRPISLYYVNGRYYDRYPDRYDEYRPDVVQVVVYERDGHYYRDCDD
jgi:hypothetical protein